MRKILLFVVMTMCCATVIFAQQNAKAKEIMDKTAANVKQSGGISAVFSGTQNGSSCSYVQYSMSEPLHFSTTSYSSLPKVTSASASATHR